MKNGQNANTVQATVTTLRIIDAIKDLKGARIAEIADHLDVPTSTVHRHISTLHAHGFVVTEGDEHHLASKFLGLGQTVLRRKRSYELIEGKVEGLAEETGELVQFAVEEQGRGAYLFRSKGEHSVTTDIHLGEYFYLHATAAGKALLSSLPPARVDEIIEREGLTSKTDQTITDPIALRECLEEVRDRGVAFNNEERIRGLRAVAVPVTNSQNFAIGSITVAGPRKRIKKEIFREELPALLSATVNELEINMAYAID
jgi:DNA-binding IclR family transcriptional regulator